MFVPSIRYRTIPQRFVLYNEPGVPHEDCAVARGGEEREEERKREGEEEIENRNNVKYNTNWWRTKRINDHM